MAIRAIRCTWSSFTSELTISLSSSLIDFCCKYGLRPDIHRRNDWPECSEGIIQPRWNNEHRAILYTPHGLIRNDKGTPRK